MARIDDQLVEALKELPPKPGDAAAQTEKKRYSEQVSQAVALTLAEELRQRGLKEARPGSRSEANGSGSERRMGRRARGQEGRRNLGDRGGMLL